MASLMLAISSYFLAAGLVLLGLSFAGVPVVQSTGLSVAVLVSLLGTVVLTQYHFLSKNRGLLILSNYADLVNQNKWIFPLTAILYFGFGFFTFVVAAGRVLNP